MLEFTEEQLTQLKNVSYQVKYSKNSATKRDVAFTVDGVVLGKIESNENVAEMLKKAEKDGIVTLTEKSVFGALEILAPNVHSPVQVARSKIKTNSLTKTEEGDEIHNILSKLEKVEKKSKCGSVRFLDRLANFLENLSHRVRALTVKVDAPCLIKFNKG